MSPFSFTPLPDRLGAPSATPRQRFAAGTLAAGTLGPDPPACEDAGSARAFREYTAPELWHLLSLDAPSVAALWTVFLAQCTGAHLGWTLPASLFLAVWILYAGDRLLDARPWSGRGAQGDLLERHRFHRRFRLPFLAGIFACTFSLLLLLICIDRSVLELYAAPGILLAGWLVLVHSRRTGPTRRKPLPKELAVGLFFPVAVFLPTFAQLSALRSKLVPFALLFALVCTLNCLFLYAWEHPQYQGNQQHQGNQAYGGALEAHGTTRWGLRHLSLLAHGTLAISLIAAVGVALPTTDMPRHGEALGRFGVACALAVLCLLLLHRNHRRFGPLALRVAADAALLTPLLFLHLHG